MTIYKSSIHFQLIKEQLESRDFRLLRKTNSGWHINDYYISENEFKQLDKDLYFIGKSNSIAVMIKRKEEYTEEEIELLAVYFKLMDQNDKLVIEDLLDKSTNMYKLYNNNYVRYYLD